MDPRLELAAGDARVTLLPTLGGAIARFAWRGRPVLRETPEEAIVAGDVRRCACYPLVPYSNRIRDAELAFEGRRYALAKNFGASPHAIHGVGWQRAWRVDRAEAARAVLEFDHDPQGEGARAWPFAFRAAQAVALSANDDGGATLVATLTIASHDPLAFPFGLGWHPFFPREAGTTLRFAAAGVWENDATLLPVALRTPPPPALDFAAARSPGTATIDHVYTGWDGRAVLESPARAAGEHATAAPGHVATIEADRACACLVCFAPAGADFVAVEPVTHETDAFNRAAAGATGTGTRVLPSGASFSCTMKITVAPPRAPR